MNEMDPSQTEIKLSPFCSSCSALYLQAQFDQFGLCYFCQTPQPFPFLHCFCVNAFKLRSSGFIFLSRLLGIVEITVFSITFSSTPNRSFPKLYATVVIYFLALPHYHDSWSLTQGHHQYDCMPPSNLVIESFPSVVQQSAMVVAAAMSRVLI